MAETTTVALRLDVEALKMIRFVVGIEGDYDNVTEWLRAAVVEKLERDDVITKYAAVQATMARIEEERARGEIKPADVAIAA